MLNAADAADNILCGLGKSLLSALFAGGLTVTLDLLSGAGKRLMILSLCFHMCFLKQPGGLGCGLRDHLIPQLLKLGYLLHGAVSRAPKRRPGRRGVFGFCGDHILICQVLRGIVVRLGKVGPDTVVIFCGAEMIGSVPEQKKLF